jgi:hypothetical protein
VTCCHAIIRLRTTALGFEVQSPAIPTEAEIRTIREGLDTTGDFTGWKKLLAAEKDVCEGPLNDPRRRLPDKSPTAPIYGVIES